MSPPRTTADDEPRDQIDLASVLHAARRRWRLVLGIALASTVVAALVVARAPPLYDVGMEVAVTALAAAGEPADGAPHDTAKPVPVNAVAFMIYTELLRSQEVADALAKDPAVLKGLFPSDWDNTRDAWGPRPTLARQVHAGLSSLLGRPIPTSPGDEVYRFLEDKLMVDQDPGKAGLATVRLHSTNPAFALRFLVLLNQASNDRLRGAMLARTEEGIGRLSAAPKSNTTTRTLELAEQIRAATLATPDFGAVVVRGPYAHLESVAGPIRSIITALIAGLAAGLGLATLLDRRRRAPAPGREDLR
jgi:subunit length determinant Wzz-like protein